MIIITHFDCYYNLHAQNNEEMPSFLNSPSWIERGTEVKRIQYM